MCFFTTTETRDIRHGVTDPPRHRSRYSAHPPPGVVRLPRGSTTSYRKYDREYDHRSSREIREPARIEYVAPSTRTRSRSRRRSVGVGEQEYRKSVTFVRD
jgi:hypothetical protein